MLDLAGFHGVYWTALGAAAASFIISMIIKRHAIDKPLRSEFTLRATNTPDDPPTAAASTSGYSYGVQEITMTELDAPSTETVPVAYYITPRGRIVPVDIA